jgi:hypothetical protein
MPDRAVTIALATALQESDLRNIRHGDRDSLGLFQQRPSQGWGTAKEIMDPTYAAAGFYKHLTEIHDYQRLPLTVAAQRVQRSGFPEAYAKHESDAALLSDALTGRAAATLTCQGRPDVTRATGPDGVRAALVRDFGRDALQEVGAEVDTKAGGSGGPSPTHSAPPATPSGASDTDTHTVTLPVRADTHSAGGRSVPQRGWQLAHWAVANASALHIERVSYAGREWTAGVTEGEWRTTDAKNGDGAGGGNGAVRITTGR